MQANEVYSCYYTAGFLPTIGRIETFQLLNGNAPFKLKSVLYDLQINDMATGIPLNLSLNNTQYFCLQIGGPTVANPPITRPFQNFLTPAGILSNGQLFRIYKPGQYFFNNFYSTTGMNFGFVMQNNDLIQSYTYYLNLVVEIQNLIT
jgi:hypothetical protein